MGNGNFCTKCGSKLTVTSKFCTKCGQRLSGYSEQTIRNKNIISKAKDFLKKERKKLLFGFFGALLVLLLVFVGIYVNKKWSEGRNESTNPSASPSSPASGNKQADNSKKSGENTPKKVDIKINQLDNQSFPVVKLYVSIMDSSGEFIEDIPLESFTIREKNRDSNEYTTQIIEVASQLEVSEALSINLVMDTSGSMNDSSKLMDAKIAAKNFINIVKPSDQLGILEFNDYVRTKCNFTNDKNALITAIDQLYPTGQTALFDAIYTALIQTSQKQGSKCVIVFTDGMNNKGTKTKDAVIELAKKTGIPVYTVGIGTGTQSDLPEVAVQTGGYHVNAPMASELESIYNDIFKVQKNQYVITYTSSNTTADNSWRDVELSLSNNDKYAGTTTREFTSEVIKPKLVALNEGRIRDIIKNNGINGNYSVVFTDLSNGGEVNIGDYRQRMPASALINVPITLAVADMIKEGRLSLNSKIPFKYTVGGRGKFGKGNDGKLHTVDELLQVMMNYSDNNCSNTFLSYIGIGEINRIIRKYGFTQTELQAPLLMTDSNRENWTTCEDISKMLGLLYSDSLPIGSAYMNANFKIEDAAKNNGILKYLPAGLNVIHHNGVRSNLYNEIAFIGAGTGGNRYILAIMGCNAPQEKLAETAARISEYIYLEMSK
jgi:VWFA-related protein